MASQEVTRITEVGAVRNAVRRLKADDKRLRDEAVVSLVRLVGRDRLQPQALVDHALREVANCLSNPNSMTRRSAVQVLGQIAPKDHQDCVTKLIKCLEDQVEWVRLAAADAIPQVVTRSCETTIYDLKRCLKHRRADVRVAGLLAMAEVAPRGDDAILAIIGKCCEDEDAFVRSAASDALHQLV